MADINLTQAEADALFEAEKHRVNDDSTDSPNPGQSITVPVQSADRREQFLLDVSRGRIELLKVKVQTRARQVVVLARLDLGGAPHRNPDGTEVPVPHLHRYREGYGDKWAYPLPAEFFTKGSDVWQKFQEFMHFCRTTKPPYIEKGLFT